MLFTSLLLFLSAQLMSVQAAARLLPRQGPVPLWGACNFPSQGINGPLPCASGSECICKDDTYSQCREEQDNSWAADPSWECQQPGDQPTGTSPSTDSAPAQPVVAAAASSPVAAAASSPVAAAASSPVAAAASSPVAAVSNPGLTSDTGNDPSTMPGQDPSSGGAGTQPATQGSCDSTSAPSGWDGVASTSYYGWMGSACDCGQTSWQWAGGSGVYSGAVNQRIFNGQLDSAGQPNCGTACGTCYELSTSGFNAYPGGVAAGSTLTIQIVDACYSSGSQWCGSTSDDYKDSSDCGVHFDIQTGPPGSDGQPAVGSDGTTWNNGGQIVYYRQTACPSSFTSEYSATCMCGAQ